MKKIFILFVILFSTVMITENVCSAKLGEETRINCAHGYYYWIRLFAQENASTNNWEEWITLADEEGVLTKVRLQDVRTCSPYDEKIEVSGGKRLASGVSFNKGNSEEPYYVKKAFNELAAFKCLCRINFHLLDGCKVFIVTKDDGYTYDYDTYFCNNGKTGPKELDFYSYRDHENYGYPCFVAGTKVSTPSGDKNIESFKVGDEVLAYDHKDNVVKTSKVTKVFKHIDKKYGELYLSNGLKLLVTAEHRFYSVDKKDYVRASKLKVNEKLLANNGKGTETVTVTKYVGSVSKADVYNITVKDFNNYFAEKILVHNLK